MTADPAAPGRDATCASLCHTLSYGIATFPEDAEDEIALLKAADRRLYAMKRAR